MIQSSEEIQTCVEVLRLLWSFAEGQTSEEVAVYRSAESSIGTGLWYESLWRFAGMMASEVFHYYLV